MTTSVIKTNYRMADITDIDFIYQSLREMVIEENILERFSQTKESLSKALFSTAKFAEALLADHNPAGLCLFSLTNRNFTLFNGPGLYIHDLYVNKNHRRHGIATGLMQRIHEIAKQRGCDRIDAVVLKNNSNGNHFYQSFDQAKEVDYIRYVRVKL